MKLELIVYTENWLKCIFSEKIAVKQYRELIQHTDIAHISKKSSVKCPIAFYFRHQFHSDSLDHVA